MIITENVKISDSILFLTTARSILADNINESKMENKTELVEFIINEASDYEIMSVLVTNEMPKEKYNIQKEMQLFSILKEQILNSSNVLMEAMGSKVFKEFILEIGPVYPHLSTAKPLLEFYMNSHSLNEDWKDWNARTVLNKAGEGISKAGKKAGEVTGIAGHSAEKSSEAGFQTAKKLYQQTQSNKALQKGIKIDKDILRKKAKESAEKGISSVKALASGPMGKYLGGAALATLLAFAGIKLYKKYFSQAAKSCKNSPDKAGCMKKFRQDAIKKQMDSLRSSLSSCKKSNNPEKCESLIQQRISKLSKQIANLAR